MAFFERLVQKSGAQTVFPKFPIMKDNWQSQKNLAERDWLIEKHKPIVYFLAKKISVSLPFATEMEDLVAYGQLGLVEASERFDPSRGNSFSTFAHYRICSAADKLLHDLQKARFVYHPARWLD